MQVYKQIQIYSDDEKERLKFALTLSQKGIVLDPLLCIMSNIQFKHYYKLFKAINGKKTRLIKELEANFTDINLD